MVCMELSKIRKYVMAFILASVYAILWIAFSALMNKFVLQEWLHPSQSGTMFVAGAIAGYIFCRITDKQ